MRSYDSARLITGAGLLCLILSPAAWAGQVRIDVQSLTFSPTPAQLNLGDHAVWVLRTGPRHTVTSGGGIPGDGLFDSGNLFYPGGAFSWKSDRTGMVPYHCTPHFADSMTARLLISASGVAVADFRITEVQYNLAGGLDLIEVANLGDAEGDLGRYRFVASNDSATVPLDVFRVPAGARVTVHVNAGNSHVEPLELYLPTLSDLPATGSLALYVPNTKSGNSLSDVTQIIDFVEWGAGGQPREATAEGAGLWTAGEFIPTVAPGRSMEFCGDRSAHGSAHWAIVSSPNFGTDGNCTTPISGDTWGRIKALYR